MFGAEEPEFSGSAVLQGLIAEHKTAQTLNLA